MNFDTIIIGGGLSGLVCGISLQKAGKRCAIVSAGQNALHFSSGTFGLLSRLPDGTPVDNPLEVIDALDENHPYRKIGAELLANLVKSVPAFLSDCGIPVQGLGGRNGYFLSPSGTMKKAWLSLDNPLLPDKDSLKDANVLLVNFPGYLDFNTAFIEEGLSKLGARCRTEMLSVHELDPLRTNPAEMRAVGIARIVDREEVWRGIVDGVLGKLKDEDTVILPAVFGLAGPEIPAQIRQGIGVRTLFVGPLPPSVPGIRTQNLLKRAFERAGGRLFPSDEVVRVRTNDNRILAVQTDNLGDTPLQADRYVLAGGSFFSRGLSALPDHVEEPLMGLDIVAVPGRENWYDKDFFGKHAYLGFGVETDGDFHPLKKGQPVRNLYAAGSILGGYNALAEGSGAGSAILTGMTVANHIISGR